MSLPSYTNVQYGHDFKAIRTFKAGGWQ